VAFDVYVHHVVATVDKLSVHVPQRVVAAASGAEYIARFGLRSDFH